MGGYVRGGHGAELHGGGKLVLSETLKADTIPLVWGGTHHGFHDGTPPPHARYQAGNQLDLYDGHLESTPTPGVQRELSTDDEAVPLPLPRMPSILPHVERPTLSLQHASLGGLDQDTGGAPQPPP